LLCCRAKAAPGRGGGPRRAGHTLLVHRAGPRRRSRRRLSRRRPARRAPAGGRPLRHTCPTRSSAGWIGASAGRRLWVRRPGTASVAADCSDV